MQVTHQIILQQYIDWATLRCFAGQGGQSALAEANAALRRMDQLAELLGTIAFGWCITHHSHLIVLPLISAVALIGLPLEVWSIHQVRTSPSYVLVPS